MYRLKVLLQSKEEESLIFNPIFRQGLNQLILGGGADSAPLEFSPVGVRRAPKMISPKTLNVYVTNKKRIGSNTPKLGLWAPIVFFLPNGYLAKRQIFRKIQVATLKLPLLTHFRAN